MEDMKDIQNKFGFTHSTPYHDGEEILIINHVVEGGIFDQSGLIEGDQIIVPSSVNGFYQLLKRHPDNNINIEIYRKVTGRNIKITISSK
jgi:C-terminal processing protease CtpA/Prc